MNIGQINQAENSYVFKAESEEGFSGQLVLHNEKVKQIEKANASLQKDKVFKIPRFLGLLKRKNEIIYCVDTKEAAIDVCNIKGNVYLPLITKRKLSEQLDKIKPEIRSKMTTVHIGAVKIILTAYFQDGKDTPIKMALIDNRINDRKDCIIGAAKGNLAYEKFMFTVYPKFRIDLKTKNLDKTLSFIHEFERKDFMNEGEKIFGITYLVAYAISNSIHSIEYAKSEYIEIEEVFKDIGTIEEKTFYEVFPEETNWTLDLTQDKKYLGEKSSQLVIKEPRNEIIERIGQAVGIPIHQ